MIEDVIFGKLSKKRWVKQLTEATEKVEYADIIKSFFQKRNQMVKYKDLNDESVTLISFPVITEYIDLNEKNIENKMLKKFNKFFSHEPSNSSISFKELESSLDINDCIGFACLPIKYLTLNYKSGEFIVRNTIVYCLTSTNDNLENMNMLTGIDNTSSFIGFKLSDLNTKLKKDIKNALIKFTEVYQKNDDADRNNVLDVNQTQNKLEQPKKTVSKKSPNLWKYSVDTTDDVSEKPTSELTMHIKSYKDSEGILPFLYTNEVVSDNRARKYNDVCNMVENNVTALEDKLLTNLASTVKYNKSNINMENDLEKDIHTEYSNNYEEINGRKYIKNFDQYLNGTSSHQDKSQLRKISLNVCDVYLRAMADAKKRIFNQDYIHSKGLNYNLHLYLTEVLSPLVVVANKCEWNELNENEGFNIFRNYVNLPNNQDFINEAYINYPTESNFPLADSAIYINGYRLYVSTKAGLNGLGASASIKSLHQFMYNPENPNELTGLAKDMKLKYTEQFELFNIFLTKSISSFDWGKISNITNGQVTSKFELKKYVQINQNIYTDLIMNILQAASFQFVQVNCQASSTTENFHFDYRVQYPAVFKGKVNIEIPNSGYVKFHIIGDKSK